MYSEVAKFEVEAENSKSCKNQGVVSQVVFSISEIFWVMLDSEIYQ